jgi:hypothetical protein
MGTAHVAVLLAFGAVETRTAGEHDVGGAEHLGLARRQLIVDFPRVGTEKIHPRDLRPSSSPA